MEYTSTTIKTERYTVTVHKPILTECERAKREQELVSALERFGKAILQEQQKK